MTKFPLSGLFNSQNVTAVYVGIVTPETALKKQIDRYREMTGEQRLALALDLHTIVGKPLGLRGEGVSSVDARCRLGKTIIAVQKQLILRKIRR